MALESDTLEDLNMFDNQETSSFVFWQPQFSYRFPESCLCTFVMLY